MLVAGEVAFDTGLETYQLRDEPRYCSAVIVPVYVPLFNMVAVPEAVLCKVMPLVAVSVCPLFRVSLAPGARVTLFRLELLSIAKVTSLATDKLVLLVKPKVEELTAELMLVCNGTISPVVKI